MRWTYLITRLFILAMLVSALWIGKDPLMRMALVHSGESAIGAKIEIGQVRWSPWDGKVYLRDLAIADPRDPMRNIVQADISYWVLNPQRLLHRELVIEHGSSTQVRFGAPRTSSGSLAPAMAETPVKTADDLIDPRPNKNELSRRWLEQFAFLPKGLARGLTEDKLTTYQISHELAEKWEPIMTVQKAELVAIQDMIQQLEASGAQKVSNPLRDGQRVEKSKRQMQEAQKKLAGLQETLTSLNAEALADLEQLTAAKATDLENIQNVISGNPFDSDLVSGQLLQENQIAYTREIIDWFQWFRDSIPEPSVDFSPTANPGVDMVLTATPPTPAFLVKHMDLDGEGKVAGQHFNFSGFAKNISTAPNLHSEPASFHLRAQGKTHLIVDCTLDRRHEKWVDSLDIHCPNLNLPAQTIGDQSSMLVKMTPCRMETDIHLKLDGENLSGDMVFRHTDLMMQIENLKTLSDGDFLADEINLDLAALTEFEIRAEIQGTLSEPQIQLQSDLGIRFAEIMNRIAQKNAGRQLDDHRSQITKINREHVDGMNQFVIEGIQGMLQQTNQQQAAVAELENQIPKKLFR